MNNFLKLALALLVIFLSSCTTTKYIIFEEREDEIFTTDELKSFLQSNESPKVVLRVDKVTFNVTDDQNADEIYNAIENRLLFNGFKVRDRQLFEQIVQNEGNTTDYSEISKQTDTDLIIELVNVNFDIEFETNIVHYPNGKTRVNQNNTFYENGASIEFKVVLIKDNDYAGLYKLNYTPCLQPCYFELSNKDRRIQELKKRQNKSEAIVNVLEGSSAFTEFVKSATDELVENMRNNK